MRYAALAAVALTVMGVASLPHIALADQINSDAAENRVAQDFRLNHSSPYYARRSFLAHDPYVPADSEREPHGYATDLRGVYGDPDDY